MFVYGDVVNMLKLGRDIDPEKLYRATYIIMPVRPILLHLDFGVDIA